MKFPDDQVAELKSLCPEVAQAEEGGATFLLLPKLNVPGLAEPMDALLCPTERDGYASRLFFPKPLPSPRQLNWNATDVRILNWSWSAHSWRVRKGLRLAQMIGEHIQAFRA